jgi:hypothetical protein
MNKPTLFPSRLLLCWVTAVGMLSAACGSSNQDAPLRSPTLDYRPPPPATADGKGVGADGVAPQDRLEEGPAAGTKAGLAPGWKAGEEGLHYDPKQRVGGEVDRKNEQSNDPDGAH